MSNLKNIILMILYTKQKQTHRYKKQTYGYQKGESHWEGIIRSTGLIDTEYSL